MDASLINSQKRAARIDYVERSICEANKQKREIDYEQLLLIIMEHFVVSRRVAQEYINVAMFRIGKKK